MKILWLSPGKEDYQSDALFHGLRVLHGSDVVDWIPYECMYEDGAKAAYGRGFTMYNLLPRLEVDRSDADRKLRTGYFDRVIIGGDWVYNPHKIYDGEPHVPYWEVIREHVPRERVAVIDGSDLQAISPYATMELGVYFKRENTGTGLPIHFAIPAQKMTCGSLEGRRLWADYEPGMPYRYDSEQDYFNDYRTAWFARTWKKEGWDCLRHREIMACGTIPFFRDIARMPETTCRDLPRKLLTEVVRDNLPETGTSVRHLSELAVGIHEWCARYCTTTALAKYVLGHLR